MIRTIKTRKTSIAQRIRQADKLFSKLIHRRGACQRCGKTRNLQTAHILSRSYKNLRWNEDNAVLLCAGCHIFWAHVNPIEFTVWIQETFPIQYAFLMRERAKTNIAVRDTIDYTINELQTKLAEK